jgi:tetratricopeptide (TPR) repeat protein
MLTAGELYFGVGRYEEAITAIKRAASQDKPRHLDEAYVYLGRSQHALGNDAEAAATFDRIKSVPNVNERIRKLFTLYAETLVASATDESFGWRRGGGQFHSVQTARRYLNSCGGRMGLDSCDQELAHRRFWIERRGPDRLGLDKPGSIWYEWTPGGTREEIKNCDDLPPNAILNEEHVAGQLGPDGYAYYVDTGSGSPHATLMRVGDPGRSIPVLNANATRTVITELNIKNPTGYLAFGPSHQLAVSGGDGI